LHGKECRVGLAAADVLRSFRGGFERHRTASPVYEEIFMRLARASGVEHFVLCILVTTAEHDPSAGRSMSATCGETCEENDTMKRITRLVMGFLKDESGTETLEWGLVCGLIVVGAITAIALIGPKVKDMWNDVNNEIQPAAR
jgi:Flp pilus assembly pilin Flp